MKYENMAVALPETRPEPIYRLGISNDDNQQKLENLNNVILTHSLTYLKSLKSIFSTQ